MLVLTTFDADELVLRALQAGAAGFLLKDTPPAEIVRAIELAHAGEGMLSPAVTRRLIALVAGDSDAGARTDDARKRLASLSPREHDVALAVGRGQANAEIAQRCTSPSRPSRRTSRACSTSSASTTASRSRCSCRTRAGASCSGQRSTTTWDSSSRSSMPPWGSQSAAPAGPLSSAALASASASSAVGASAVACTMPV